MPPGLGQSASCSRSYAHFTEDWSVCLARGSCGGDQGLSIDVTALLPVNSIPKYYNSTSYLREYKSLLKKQQGNKALTSRATGFGTRDHKSKRTVDTLQAAIGSVEIQVSIDTVHPTSIDTVHPTSIDTLYPTSIDTAHQPSIDTAHQPSIDTVHPPSTDTVHPPSTDTVHLPSNTTWLEAEKGEVLILKVDENEMLRDEEGRTRNSAGQLINAQGAVIPDKSTDVSSCDLVPDVDREITMEDFLELEDETQPENLDHNLEKKLDDYQHTSKRDLETSLEASIDRHPPYIIDRHPPYIIDQHTPYIIDHHPRDSIDLHPPESIDRHPVLDEPYGFVVEMEPIEERVHESEASRNDDYKHLRPLTCAEEVVGLHKRVKRIHDPVKIVVPCPVVEVESPIPPDRSMQFSSYIEVLDDNQYVEASQRGLRFRDEVDKGPAEPVSIDTDRTPSIDINKSASIDTTTSPSIDTTASPSIDTITSSSIDTGRVSQHKVFDVCGNLRDGETTTRSDKSGRKKKRNWKKRKRIMGDSQLSLISRFSDGVRKSRVHSICFSQPFAKLQALLIAEMIDKGEESMEEAFTQE
ncbi:hypothetical protein F2Q69_00013822 [Brassica cretica]|uniref:Uncharacterized protein n=1 Tax=Brassica cretica TaxID=69181 RepID=A0A8S9QWE6_BRACR|nr:hypothetical protein F2Q69_00013822 [Brassica cretica]